MLPTRMCSVPRHSNGSGGRGWGGVLASTETSPAFASAGISNHCSFGSSVAGFVEQTKILYFPSFASGVTACHYYASYQNCARQHAFQGRVRPRESARERERARARGSVREREREKGGGEGGGGTECGAPPNPCRRWRITPYQCRRANNFKSGWERVLSLANPETDDLGYPVSESTFCAQPPPLE